MCYVSPEGKLCVSVELGRVGGWVGQHNVLGKTALLRERVSLCCPGWPQTPGLKFTLLSLLPK
jgi:hypothetical protein